MYWSMAISVNDGTSRAAPNAGIPRKPPDWAVTGAKGRGRSALSSIYIDPIDEEVTNIRLFRRWQEIEENEVRYKEYCTG